MIAITDHDTVFHFEEVQKVCRQNGLETIRGVEMSCYDYDVHKKVHVVGLGLNNNPYHVEKLCQKTLQCRDEYHHELIKILNQKGLNITYEDAKEYAPYNIVFKMHLFLAIVHKYPEYNDINKYRELFMSETSLDVDSKMGYIDIKEGIKAIREDGGIAIIAHPCEYKNYDEIEKYVSYGLQGIEISHPSMESEDYPLTQELANRFHLIRSGGSDFHNIHLTAIGDFGLTKDKLTIKEQNHFVDHLKIKYILDFRDKAEASLAPDRQHENILYERISALKMQSHDQYGFDFGTMLQGEMTKEKYNYLMSYIKAGYKEMAFNNPAYHRLFELLLRNDGYVYFHCTAGKDRTGVAGFLIMIALGMSEEDAIQEYLLSNIYLKESNDELCQQLQIPEKLREECRPLLYVQRELIEIMIQSIRVKYRSYDEFLLQEYNFDNEKRRRLKEIYCE